MAWVEKKYVECPKDKKEMSYKCKDFLNTLKKTQLEFTTMLLYF